MSEKTVRDLRRRAVAVAATAPPPLPPPAESCDEDAGEAERAGSLGGRKVAVAAQATRAAAAATVTGH